MDFSILDTIIISSASIKYYEFEKDRFVSVSGGMIVDLENDTYHKWSDPSKQEPIREVEELNETKKISAHGVVKLLDINNAKHL